jgi:hypothetical protein
MKSEPKTKKSMSNIDFERNPSVSPDRSVDVSIEETKIILFLN